MTLLLSSTAERADVWSEVFAEAGAPLWTDPTVVARDEVTVLACWYPPEDLSIYPNLKAVLSVGAGVDQMPKLPEGIALCRTEAPGISAMVRDWVVMACLMLHRDMPKYLAQAQDHAWQAHPVALCQTRRIGILGMGRIGAMAAKTLNALGFLVSGWSRSGASVPGVEVLSEPELPTLLAQSDILVCLLPLTETTRGILNADLFDQLPKGAHLVHAGRGAQLDMDALGAALHSGQLGSAMLDVTDPEPLPADHALWSDPRVVITPHVAAATDAREGALHALDLLKALENKAPLPGLVDQTRGY